MIDVNKKGKVCLNLLSLMCGVITAHLFLLAYFMF